MVALPWWLTLLTLMLAAFGGWFVAGRKLAARSGLTLENALRRLPGATLAIVGVLTVLIAALALALRAPALIWYLPFWWQYWFAGLIWTAGAGLFAFIAGLACGIAWRTGHAQRRGLLVATPVLLVAMLLPQWSFTRPIADHLQHEAERDGTILQSSGSSCVAASGANIARLLGMASIDEPAMARRMGTTALGTGMPQAVVAMRELGIECTPSGPRNTDPAQLATPAFLFVDDAAAGPEGHAIVLQRIMADGRFALIDPLYGKSIKTRAALDAVWHGLAAGCRRLGAAP